MTKLKKHKIYFYVFLGLAFLGLIDMATRQLISDQYNLSDTGLISLYFGKFFAIFSSSVGAWAITFLSFIFSFTLFWIIIAVVEYFTIRKINKSNLKHEKEDSNN